MLPQALPEGSPRLLFSLSKAGVVTSSQQTVEMDDFRARRPTIDARSLTQARADAVTVLG